MHLGVWREVIHGLEWGREIGFNEEWSMPGTEIRNEGWKANGIDVAIC